MDSEVDKRLEKLGREDLAGIAAVANARAAYMRFKDLFYGERFAELREEGAPVQRRSGRRLGRRTRTIRRRCTSISWSAPTR